MYAFIHIPKTAGTTLRFLFRSAFSSRHCDAKMRPFRRKESDWFEAQDAKLIKTAYPRLKSLSGHRICCFSDLGDAIEGIKYFTVLRDPVQRYISSFNHQYRGNIEALTIDNLEAYIADPATHNVQTRWICGQENADLAIKVIRDDIDIVGLTERFDESLLILKQWMAEPEFEINYVTRRKAPKKAKLPYTSDARLHQLIQQVNKEDIKLYQYVVDEIFPAQVANYGEDFEADLSAFMQQQKDFIAKPEPRLGVIKRNLIYKPLLHLPTFSK